MRVLKWWDEGEVREMGEGIASGTTPPRDSLGGSPGASCVEVDDLDEARRISEGRTVRRSLCYVGVGESSALGIVDDILELGSGI